MADPPSLTVPLSQNTATVLEFRCLFTHDLRRKQKRWNDGTLRFHTFNKRIMVYDDNSNYLGDSHWQDSRAVQDGDELSLQNGVLVEIGEAVQSTQSDLTPLFEKQQQSKVDRIQKIQKGRAMNIGSANSQQRHRSLASLLGPARTQGARVTASISPYDTRHGQPNDGSEPPNKRRKVTGQALLAPRGGISIAITGKPLDTALSPGPSTLPGETPKSFETRTTQKLAESQKAFRRRELVDLVSCETNDNAPPRPQGNTSVRRPRQSLTPPTNRDNSSPVRNAWCSPSIGSANRSQNGYQMNDVDEGRAESLLTTDARQTHDRPPGLSVSGANEQLDLPNISTNPQPGPSRSRKAVATNRPTLSTDPTLTESFPRPSAAISLNPDSRKKLLQLAKSRPKPKLLCLQTSSAPSAKASLTKKPYDAATRSRVAEPVTSDSSSSQKSESLPRNHRQHTASRPLLESLNSAASTASPLAQQPRLADNGLRRQEAADAHATGIAQGMVDIEREQARLDARLMQRSSDAHITRPATRELRRVQSETLEISTSRTTNFSASAAEQRHTRQQGQEGQARAKNSRREPLRKIQSANPVAMPLFKQPHHQLPKQPEAKDVGPWCTEASDLFDWRPPDWEERLTSVPASVAMVD